MVTKKQRYKSYILQRAHDFQEIDMYLQLRHIFIYIHYMYIHIFIIFESWD